MKKFAYVLAIVVLGLASCTPKSYTITGTVEGAADGDKVVLMKQTDRQFIPVDSTVIAKEKFTLTGVQDSAAFHFLVCRGEEGVEPAYIGFFLENGNIKVNLKTEGGGVVSGTPSNDALQVFQGKLQAVFDKQETLMNEVESATPEVRQAKMAEAEALDSEIVAVVKEAVKNNSSTPLGLFFLNVYSSYLGYDDVEQLISILPAQYQKDKAVVAMKEGIDKAKKTAVGQKFIDLEMEDPKGNPVKLSDYAGKGKLVLVDFWASWCGPCRNEMPKLVEAYAKYKDKNFEIVGVSLDENAEAWKKGLAELGMTWPQMSDLKSWDSKATRLYAIRGIPHVVLIDGEGTVISRGLHGEELHAKLAELLQ